MFSVKILPFLFKGIFWITKCIWQYAEFSGTVHLIIGNTVFEQIWSKNSKLSVWTEIWYLD